MNHEINRFRWGSFFAAVATISLFLYCIGYTVDGTEESILNTLARTQAAIFAIVFSVLILGVRLSASRYSPRLASEFRSNPHYYWTVGTFGISIGYDIIGLFILSAVPPIYTTVGLVAAFGLALTAAWTMWDFVNETLERTTPEGILQTLNENLTPDSIVSQAHKRYFPNESRECCPNATKQSLSV